jgi:L-ascorbate metabolism protein UlaG (beta-lactamase superfamily)
MPSAPVYLRPDVQVDPLIHRWYAWVQIIAPASAAFNVLERQNKAMKSFAASPDLHVAALKNPAMRGGPFIDLPASEAPAVGDLLRHMARHTERQAKFVEAVRELDGLLERRGDGGTLETLYADIPPVLRGYVELTYDRHHRPDFRVFESPLYDSELYDEGAQSLMLGQFAGDDARPFIFSTPRLERPDSVDIRLPFRSAAYDSLFDARVKSRRVAELEEELEIGDRDHATFRLLFTEQAPQPRPPYQAPEPRVRYFGHACVLVEASGLSILVDPMIPYAGDRPGIGCFTFRDLPDRIDYILITHGHHDHISLETLMQLRRRVGTIVVGKNVEGNMLDPSLRLLLQRQGFRDIHELSEFDRIDLDIGAITALPFMGEHHDLGVGSKLCYHLRINGRSMMFAADSCNFGHSVYERACRGLGALDALFIGMECDGAPVSWVYGPAFTKRLARDKDRSRRGRASDCKEVLNLLENIDCKRVYVYAMGSEPWMQYVLDVHYTDSSNPIIQSQQLIDACRSRGIFAERLHGATEMVFSG